MKENPVLQSPAHLADPKIHQIGRRVYPGQVVTDAAAGKRPCDFVSFGEHHAEWPAQVVRQHAEMSRLGGRIQFDAALRRVFLQLPSIFGKGVDPFFLIPGGSVAEAHGGLRGPDGCPSVPSRADGGSREGGCRGRGQS